MNKQKIEILETDLIMQKVLDAKFNDPVKIRKNNVCIVNHYVLGKLNQLGIKYKKL